MSLSSSNLDLNLLKVFVITYQEQNLKRAALKLNCSPPAVSMKLSKLRDNYGKNLFVKTPTGFEPTPFSDDLYQSIEPLLSQITENLEHVGEFDPGNIQGTIYLAMGRHLLPWLAPKVYQAIQERAPQSSLVADFFTTSTVEGLKQDNIDIGIEYYYRDLPKEICEIPVGNYSFSFVVREEHPFRKAEATLEELLDYDFALINHTLEPSGHAGELVKELLRDKVKVVMKFSSPSFAAIVNALRNNDLICPVSDNLFAGYSEGLRRIKVTDLGILHDNPVNAYIHQRNRHSEKHKWLIEQIRKAFRHRS